MKFKLQIADLNGALDIVSIAPPRPLTSKEGGGGYLFVVRDGRCFIYSRDALHLARVDVPVEEVEGEGSFIYPSEKIGSTKYLDGWIEIEAGYDKDDDRHWIRYETEGGAKAKRSTFDPRLMQPLDEALEKASEGYTYPATLLKEAISMTKGYLAKPTNSRAEKNFQTMQLFDASKPEWEPGNGNLFAADGVQACWVYCEVFENKGLSIHGQHLPFILSFLGKCEGDITVRQAEGVTFLVSATGNVFGWSQTVKQHGRFGYYAAKLDQYVLKAPKDLISKALRHTRTELDPRRNKIRVNYDHNDKTLLFQVSEGSGQASSVPVGVVPVTGEDGSGAKGAENDFGINANVDQLLGAIDPMKGHEVQLRVAIVPAKAGRKEGAMIRTIEEFWLSDAGKVLISPDDEKGKAHLCRVTRFTPSRD
jgi:hypothetical protein